MSEFGLLIWLWFCFFVLQ